MLRARQTARILAEPHPRALVRTAAALNEVRSSWSGLPFGALPPRVNLYEPRRSVGDETIEDVATRMARLIRRLVRRHPGAVICCVSHGDPIASVRSMFLGVPLELSNLRGAALPQKCSITKLTFTTPDALPVIEAFDPPHERRAR